MGFYWQTYFYPDAKDESKRIMLAAIDPIIEEKDLLQGFVLKEELMQHFSHLLKKKEITEASRIVEYVTSTYVELLTKTQELPIK